MPQHVIRYIAVISWEGQANGLPPALCAYMIFDQYDRAIFDKVIDANFEAYAQRQAFFCSQDQNRVIDIREVPSDRRMVPMRWIVQITCDVQPLVGEMSLPDEDGVERMTDGSEPVKQ